MIYPTCPECKSENTYHDSIQLFARIVRMNGRAKKRIKMMMC